MRYIYLLTPAGLVQKSRLTADFPNQKIAEYEILREEIEQLKTELPSSPQFSGHIETE